MEAALTDIFGHDRRTTITANKCVSPPIGCGGDANDFKDELSRREFTISGLCQHCQDKVFGDDGEGTKMWTLESALPLIRELEAACNPWGYYTALAGSVLYAGHSDNDLDIHLYERNDDGSCHDSAKAFQWFESRGWHFTLCGQPLAYGSDASVFEAEKDGRVINLFFTALEWVDAPHGTPTPPTPLSAK